MVCYNEADFPGSIHERGGFRHPGYLRIEDQIDEIGQKYRTQRILRGAMIWIAAMVAASFAAALSAHFLGSGLWARIVLVAWAGCGRSSAPGGGLPGRCSSVPMPLK